MDGKVPRHIGGRPILGSASWALSASRCVSPHVLCAAALILFLGGIAAWSMPTDIFPEINIPVVTVIWQYTGLSTPEMEQRVTTYSQYAISSNVNGIKNIEAQTLERPVGAEDLLPAGRQSRPRHRADRLGDQRDPRADAARHPAADHRAVQRLERAGAAAQPQLRHAQRAAALRLRHLPSAPAAGADPRRHPADAGRRQVPPDHGRYRSRQAAGQGPDAARRRQRGQRPEPDAARRARPRSATRNTPCAPTRRRRRSTTSTTSRSSSSTAPPSS